MTITMKAAVAAAGVDPASIAEQLHSANASEVHALASIFHDAAQMLTESGSLADLAVNEAQGAGQIMDQTPVDLLSEVLATYRTLQSTPAELEHIAVSLGVVADLIPPTQQWATSMLDDVHAQVHRINGAFQLSVATSQPGVDLRPQFLQYAADAVQEAAQSLTALVASYDDALLQMSHQLQLVGYLLPATADVGYTYESIYLYAGGSPEVPDVGTEAGQVADWWASLSGQQQTILMATAGSMLAPLQGLPAHVYDMVNSRALSDDDVESTAHIQLAAEHYAQAMGLPADLPIEQLVAHAVETVKEDYGLSIPPAASVLLYLCQRQRTLAKTQQAIADDEQERLLLEYDRDQFDGDGNVVISIGDPDAAQHVAVLVPGIGNSIETISGQVSAGAILYENMSDFEPDEASAVIVYQGYDSPAGVSLSDPLAALEALGSEHAEEGGVLLKNDVAGYVAANTQADGTDPHVTLIGHSYGTAVIGEAMQPTLGAGLTDGVISAPADDVVALGSPGMHAQSVHELMIDAQHVWATTAPGDIVTMLTDIFSPMTPGLHGPLPTNENFGAVVFDAGPARGHTEYLGMLALGGSLGVAPHPIDNIAAIATGNYQDVVLAK